MKIPYRFNPFGKDSLKELSYIESTGSQYINTNVKPDFANGDSIEISFYRSPDTEANVVFGSRGANIRNGLYLIANSIICCGSEDYTTVAMDTRGERLITINGEKIVNNGVEYSMPRQITTAFPFFLFSLNSSGTPIVYISGTKLYYFKYFKNGVLTQHLVPRLDENDVPCSLDLVTEDKLYDAGSGSTPFIYE